MLADEVADEGADHEDVGVREIDEAQHAIDHRVAKRDERIDGPEGQAVKELLKEFGQAERWGIFRGRRAPVNGRVSVRPAVWPTLRAPRSRRIRTGRS